MQRPDVAARPVELHGVKQPVHGAPRRLVGALHRREVGMGAHVVGRQKQVGNALWSPRGAAPTCRPGSPAAARHSAGSPARVGSMSMSGSRNHECRSSSRSSSSLDIDRALELLPRLAHDLLARALHGGAAVRSRRAPVGDIDREDAVHVAVAEQLWRHAAPELKLRNAGQRPFGVDVNHVPVRRSAGRGANRTARRSSTRRSAPARADWPASGRRPAGGPFTSGAMRSSGSAAR